MSGIEVFYNAIVNIKNKKSVREFFIPRNLLILFIFTNLFLYYDRASIAGSLPIIERNLKLTSIQTGILGSSFTIGYMSLSPFFGYIERSYPAPWILFFGLILFCISSISMVSSFSYISILISRIFMGISQSSFASIAPPYIENMSPNNQKKTWLGLYFSSIAFGAAIGYLVSGLISTYMSWRYCFLIQFLFMMIPSLLFLLIPEDPNSKIKNKEKQKRSSLIAKDFEKTLGNEDTTVSINSINETNINKEDDDIIEIKILEEDDDDTITETIEFNNNIPKNNIKNKKFKDILLILLKNEMYVIISIGNVLLNFVMGAIAFWCPTFVYEILGLPLELSSIYIGLMTLFSGIFGTIAGGMIVDKFGGTSNDSKIKFSLKYISITIIIIFPLFISAGLSSDVGTFFILFFISEVLLFACVAPINGLILDVVEEEYKTMSNSVQLTIINIGQLPSPFIIGLLRHYTNLRYCMALLSVMLLFGSITFIIAYILKAKIWKKDVVSTENA